MEEKIKKIPQADINEQQKMSMTTASRTLKYNQETKPKVRLRKGVATVGGQSGLQGNFKVNQRYIARPYLKNNNQMIM